MRHELYATTSEYTNIDIAATQGATKPIAAKGVINKCQAIDPYKFCLEIPVVRSSID